MRTVRLILGDQLDPLHGWYEAPSRDVLHVMMEVRQETDYALHHAQKIIAIFAAMRDFARHLRSQGHQVRYIAIDDPGNRQSVPGNLSRVIEESGAEAFEYQEPDEWRLDRQLAEFAAGLDIPARMIPSEHFLTERNAAGQFFAHRRQWLMESFYRHMRIEHGVLLEGDRAPAGGKWNFDHANRKSWPGDPPEPEDPRPTHDHRALWRTVRDAGVQSFGEPHASRVRWPINRDEALAHLDRFVAEALPHFGDYQDAMSRKARRLFHSLLSFALNTKMLHPREVIDRAEEAWRAGEAPLAAVEGFIRQILGWREYVRGVYWHHMPGYGGRNFFGHDRALPPWFWTGETRMACLSRAIGQSLDDAHAHHIQRLMVIGNFALLAGLDPDEVHQWYLGVYVDAFEWVEMPNTLGMSQYADGGLLATKPYVSSAAYINRMSDYCRGCAYDPKKRTGEGACPFNALYWDFLARHRRKLHGNRRLAMIYRQLDRMDRDTLDGLRRRAAAVKDALDTL
jgi:deoxyribodipyrimidine photolyase-related protein